MQEGRRPPSGHLLTIGASDIVCLFEASDDESLAAAAAQPGLGRETPHDTMRAYSQTEFEGIVSRAVNQTSRAPGSSQATAAASARRRSDLSTTSTSGPSGRKRGRSRSVTCGQRTVAPVQELDDLGFAGAVRAPPRGDRTSRRSWFRVTPRTSPPSRTESREHPDVLEAEAGCTAVPDSRAARSRTGSCAQRAGVVRVARKSGRAGRRPARQLLLRDAGGGSGASRVMSSASRRDRR